MRAREWYEWILLGEVPNQRFIARKLGITERYVGRVLECAFLAPDTVNAILEGRQPHDLTLQKLTRRLPANWAEQRKQLGFPSLQPLTNSDLSIGRSQIAFLQVHHVFFPNFDRAGHYETRVLAL